MKATDFCFEFLFGAMRLPLVFAGESFAPRTTSCGFRRTARTSNLCGAFASIAMAAVQLHQRFVGLGSYVRTADQMRNLRASPAFAKYKCETTRCEVDPSRLLVACRNVDLAKQLSSTKQK